MLNDENLASSSPTRLRELAHARTGDKGNRLTLSIVAYDLRDFERLERSVTAERVRAHYADFLSTDKHSRVDRYVLPQLGALNFVLHGALGGGVTRSLALDAHGKCLGQAILSLEV
jgi:hypothetical protein